MLCRFRILSASSARHGRRLCTAQEQTPSPSACLGAGLAGGGFGGLVGIGGGTIMVPLMTAYAKMTQHQAVVTEHMEAATQQWRNQGWYRTYQ